MVDDFAFNHQLLLWFWGYGVRQPIFMKKCPLVCIYSSIVCCVNGHANWHSTNNLEGIGTKPVKLACAGKSWLSQPINLLLKLVVTELWLPKEVQMMMNVNWSWVPMWLHPHVFFFWRYCCSVAIILRENWLSQPSFSECDSTPNLKHTARDLMFRGKWSSNLWPKGGPLTHSTYRQLGSPLQQLWKLGLKTNGLGVFIPLGETDT